MNRDLDGLEMNDTNTKKLLKDFPEFFPSSNPLFSSRILVPFTLDCGDGWFKLIYQLCKDIKKVIDNTPKDPPSVTFIQIKEKFGTLRLYYAGGNDVIEKLIEEAEEKSAHICEVCGRRGSLSVSGGWYKTLCPYHRKKEGYEKVEEEE